jgi:hypothetical protein
MIIEVPPPHGSEQLPGDDQRKVKALPYKTKVTFHWPPLLVAVHGSRTGKRDLTRYLREIGLRYLL